MFWRLPWLMPNWCLNNLTIEHEDGYMVDRFVKAYEEGNTCNEFIPVPEDIGEGWYDFCVNNWGTKWDIGCENTRTHGLKPTRVGNQVTVIVRDPDGSEVIITIDLDDPIIPEGILELPKTGGMPLSIYLAIGGMLVVLGLIFRRRKA